MKELFLPYYVNTGRLLDIYSILNQGYSEYEELKSSSNSINQSGGNHEGSISVGFKMIKVGVGASGNKEKTTDIGTCVTEKKIQTIPSVLKIVLDEMKHHKYLTELDKADVGDFVELDSVTFQINSIKYLMDEFEAIMNLTALIPSEDDKKSGGKSPKNDMKQFNNISKLIRSLGDGEEVLYENSNSAIFGNIYDECLYQAVKSDIINTRLRCLCQIKRKYEDGTSLMKNTIISKLKDETTKEKLFNMMYIVTKNEVYDFDSTAVSEISGKPVYEIEIIALYK